MTMVNLFQVAPQDQSIGYLSQIFGTVSGVLANPVNPQAGAITLLSTMFKTFNSVILVCAVLMLVYITIIGVIATAHEGEFMGRKMNNIWIPIRAVLGIALLVPTGAGYCAIQIVMMWVIVQGVGAADVLWNTALAYVSVESPYSAIGMTGPQTGQVLNGLFQGLVCQTSTGGTVPPFTPATGCPNGKCTYSLGDCGSLNYCDQGSSCSPANNPPGNGTSTAGSSVECLTCQAQVNALTAIINQVFNPVAQSFVAADASYQQFYANSGSPQGQQGGNNWQWINSYCSAQNPPIPQNQCCVGNGHPGPTSTCQAPLNTMPPLNDSSTVPMDQNSASSQAVQGLYWPYWSQLGPSLGVGSNFIGIAVGQYNDMANAAFTNYIQSQAQTMSQGNNTLSNAASNGWIYAGALYYTIANSNNNTLKGSIPTLEWIAPDPNSSKLKNSRNNYTAASYLTQAASGISMPGGATASQFASVTSSLSSFPSSLSSAFTSNVSSQGGNPLANLVSLGQGLLIGAFALFIVVSVTVLVAGISLGIGSIEILGFGIPALPAIFNLIEIFLIPAVYGALGLMVSIGATLAIYTPLLPFIYFTFGAIAWMISTVEAMVAGPLVALFIINPKGEHEIMGKAEPALMLLFNIFLRPSLMIFGLMAAMLLATVVLTLINATFNIVQNSGAVSHSDLLSIIIVYVAYWMIVLGALNKCFQVINVIPQQVMRWIGHQAEGVEAPTEAIKGGIEAGAGKVGGAAPQGVSDEKAAGREARYKEYAGKKNTGGTATGGSPSGGGT